MLWRQYTLEEFQTINDSFGILDRWWKGYPLRVWEIAHMKKFRLGNMPETISQFLEVESDVVNRFMNGDETAILPFLILRNVYQDHRKAYDVCIRDVRNDLTIALEFHDILNNHLLEIV